MKPWTVLILTLISTSTWCEDVIDLGSLEIDGETRRPMITYTETSQNVIKAMTHQLSNNAKLYAANLDMDKNAGYPVINEFKFSPIGEIQTDTTIQLINTLKGE